MIPSTVPELLANVVLASQEAPGTLPTTLFTADSFKSLAGLVGLTAIIPNGVRRAFGIDCPAWGSLLIALAACIGNVALGNGGLVEYILAIPNAFLVFLSAAGATEAGAAALKRTRQREALDRGDRGEIAEPHGKRFFKSWFSQSNRP